MIIPWHQSHHTLLVQQADAGRLAHGWLVCGSEGLGKVDFVRTIAKRLLCQAPVGAFACGHCNACRLFQEGSHPDWYRVAPLEGSNSIGIDQIREVSDRLVRSPSLGAKQIVCLTPAEAMQSAGMNALLKTLEEPSSASVLFLVSHRPSLLPMTILSRVQRLNMAMPNPDQAHGWLQEQVKDAKGIDMAWALTHSPYKALAYLQNTQIQQQYQGILQALINPQTPWHLWAESFETREDAMLLLDMMLRVLLACLKVRSGGISVLVQACPPSLQQEGIWVMQKRIMATYPLLRAGSGVGLQGAVEDVCMHWQAMWQGKLQQRCV